MNSFILKNDQNRCFELSKGGIIVNTAIGNIQFGVPFGTLNELNEMQIEIPKIFVVPTTLFEKKYMINLMDIEPIVMHHYLKNKTKVILIVSKENEKIIKKMFDEEVFGPDEFKVQIKIFLFCFCFKATG